MFAGQQIGQRVVVARHQFQELHQDANPALRIGRRPFRLRRLGVLDRGAQLGLGGQRHLGLDVAGHRLKHVREPARCALDLTATDKMSDCAHAFLPRAVQVPILTASCSLCSVWKGIFTRSRICENAALAAFPATYDQRRMRFAASASFNAAPTWRPFGARISSPSALRRCRTTQHGLAPGAENLVGKLAIAGDAGQHQRPHHGRDRCHRLLARGLARNVRDLRGQHVDHLFQLGRERLAGFRAFAGDFGAQRRNRAAMAGIVAMSRRQIGIHDGGKALLRRRLFRQFAPALGRTVHRMRKRLDDQRFPGIEMGVESAMGQSGVLHQVGDADAVRTLLAKPDRGLLHDPRVGFELVFPGVSHRRPIRCLKSYNSIRRRGKLLLFRSACPEIAFSTELDKAGV